MSKRAEMIGKRFGRLLALAFAGLNKHSRAIWRCRCDCGKMVTVEGQLLRTKHSQSCGCYKRDNARLEKGESSFNSLYRVYRNMAKKRGLSFSLTKDEFKSLTKQNCYYCDKNPQQIIKAINRNYGDYVYNGVDRVDNSKGYEPDNVVACCKLCNWMKRDLSQESFVRHIFDLMLHFSGALQPT